MQISQLFTRKSPPVLGLDISSTSVKLVELSLQNGRYRVESFAVEPLPPNSVVEKSINDIDAIGEAVQRVVKRAKAKSKHAAVAVAGSSVITKTIPMPANLSETELEDQIELEADQYVPYPLEEVSLDFEVIGQTVNNPDTIDVLLAACRTETVDMRTAAIESGGLSAKIVDIEAYATENAFQLLVDQIPNQGTDKTIALIDVGATMTTLNVLHDQKLIYTRESMFGGKQLTEEIMRRYSLSYEEAGMAKRQGGLPENYATEVLEPFKETMCQQVSRSLQFFFSSSQYNNIDHILLAGGSASIEGISELITERTSIDTSIANPFASMSLSSDVKPQSLSSDAPALLIACGLALRSFG